MDFSVFTWIFFASVIYISLLDFDFVSASQSEENESTTLQDLLVKMTQMASKMDALQTENIAITTQFDQLKIQNQEFKSELDFIRLQNQDLKSQLKILEAQVGSSSTTNLEALKELNEISDIKKRLLSASDPSDIHSLELKLQELTANVNSIDAKYASVIYSLQQSIQMQSVSNVTSSLISIRQDMQRNFGNLSAQIYLLQYSTQSQIASVNTKSSQGSTYTRWGKKTCPTNSELIYYGYMAGSFYKVTDSASVHLCLPMDPEFLPDARDRFGFAIGVEYGENFNGENTSHQNAACAVCRSESTSTVMIPGRKHCYSGWNMEFTGRFSCHINTVFRTWNLQVA